MRMTQETVFASVNGNLCWTCVDPVYTLSARKQPCNDGRINVNKIAQQNTTTSLASTPESGKWIEPFLMKVKIMSSMGSRCGTMPLTRDGALIALIYSLQPPCLSDDWMDLPALTSV